MTYAERALLVMIAKVLEALMWQGPRPSSTLHGDFLAAMKSVEQQGEHE